jgi:hypothetical protein
MGRGRPKKIKYQRLNQVKRGRILGLREKGDSFKKIAKKVGCSNRGVAKFIKKFKEKKTSEDLKRAPRPRVTTPREDRLIKFKHATNSWANAVQISKELNAELGRKVCSIETVRNRLKAEGLHGRVARRKPLITKAQAGKRLKWANQFKDYTASDWKKVTFSDETSFTLFPERGKVYIWRRPGEEYKLGNIIPIVKFGGGKIMVWGVFSYYGVGPLYWIQGTLTGAKYRGILKAHLAPYLRELSKEKGQKFIFQHDNDPKHRSNVVKNYLGNQKFEVLPWASQSPDLNPIENLWDQVKDQISARKDRASSLHDVFRILQEEWEKIPLDYIQNLIESMPRRCKAVIESKGYSTKY